MKLRCLDLLLGESDQLFGVSARKGPSGSHSRWWPHLLCPILVVEDAGAVAEFRKLVQQTSVSACCWLFLLPISFLEAPVASKEKPNRRMGVSVCVRQAVINLCMGGV